MISAYSVGGDGWRTRGTMAGGGVTKGDRVAKGDGFVAVGDGVAKGYGVAMGDGGDDGSSGSSHEMSDGSVDRNVVGFLGCEGDSV